MPLKTLAELGAEIDEAVPATSGQFKATGPGLNAVLQSLATELTTLPAAVRATYKASLLFANGDDLVGPDFHDVAAELTRAVLSPDATELKVSVNGGSSFTILNVTNGIWTGNFTIPAHSSVFYRVTFAGAALSAGVVLTIQETI